MRYFSSALIPSTPVAPWYALLPFYTLHFGRHYGWRKTPNAHSATSSVAESIVVEAGLRKSLITRQNIAQLTHCRAPAETLVDMLVNLIRISLATTCEVVVNRFSNTAGTAQTSTPQSLRLHRFFALAARRAQVNELSITPLILSPVDSPSFTGSPGQCQAVQQSSRLFGIRPLEWPKRLRMGSHQLGDSVSGWSAWDGRNCDHAPMSFRGSQLNPSAT